MIQRIFFLFFIFCHSHASQSPGSIPEDYWNPIKYPQHHRPLIAKNGLPNVPRSPYEMPPALSVTSPPHGGYYEPTKAYTRGPFPYVSLTTNPTFDPVRISLNDPQHLLNELKQTGHYQTEENSNSHKEYDKVVSNTGIFYPVEKTNTGDLIGYVNVPYYHVPKLNKEKVATQETTIITTHTNPALFTTKATVKPRIYTTKTAKPTILTTASVNTKLITTKPALITTTTTPKTMTTIINPETTVKVTTTTYPIKSTNPKSITTKVDDDEITYDGTTKKDIPTNKVTLTPPPTTSSYTTAGVNPNYETKIKTSNDYMREWNLIFPPSAVPRKGYEVVPINPYIPPSAVKRPFPKLAFLPSPNYGPSGFGPPFLGTTKSHPVWIPWWKTTPQPIPQRPFTPPSFYTTKQNVVITNTKNFPQHITQPPKIHKSYVTQKPPSTSSFEIDFETSPPKTAPPSKAPKLVTTSKKVLSSTQSTFTGQIEFEKETKVFTRPRVTFTKRPSVQTTSAIDFEEVTERIKIFSKETTLATRPSTKLSSTQSPQTTETDFWTWPSIATTKTTPKQITNKIISPQFITQRPSPTFNTKVTAPPLIIISQKPVEEVTDDFDSIFKTHPTLKPLVKTTEMPNVWITESNKETTKGPDLKFEEMTERPDVKFEEVTEKPHIKFEEITERPHVRVTGNVKFEEVSEKPFVKFEESTERPDVKFEEVTEELHITERPHTTERPRITKKPLIIVTDGVKFEENTERFTESPHHKATDGVKFEEFTERVTESTKITHKPKTTKSEIEIKPSIVTDNMDLEEDIDKVSTTLSIPQTTKTVQTTPKIIIFEKSTSTESPSIFERITTDEIDAFLFTSSTTPAIPSPVTVKPIVTTKQTISTSAISSSLSPTTISFEKVTEPSQLFETTQSVATDRSDQSTLFPKIETTTTQNVIFEKETEKVFIEEAQFEKGSTLIGSQQTTTALTSRPLSLSIAHTIAPQIESNELFTIDKSIFDVVDKLKNAFATKITFPTTTTSPTTTKKPTKSGGHVKECDEIKDLLTKPPSESLLPSTKTSSHTSKSIIPDSFTIEPSKTTETLLHSSEEVMTEMLSITSTHKPIPPKINVISQTIPNRTETNGVGISKTITLKPKTIEFVQTSTAPISLQILTTIPFTTHISIVTDNIELMETTPRRGGIKKYEPKGGSRVVESKATTKVFRGENTTEFVNEKSTTEFVNEKSTTEFVNEKSTAEFVNEKSTAEFIEPKTTTRLIKPKPTTDNPKEMSISQIIAEKVTTGTIKEKVSTQNIKHDLTTKPFEQHTKTSQTTLIPEFTGTELTVVTNRKPTTTTPNPIQIITKTATPKVIKIKATTSVTESIKTHPATTTTSFTKISEPRTTTQFITMAPTISTTKSSKSSKPTLPSKLQNTTMSSLTTEFPFSVDQNFNFENINTIGGEVSTSNIPIQLTNFQTLPFKTTPSPVSIESVFNTVSNIFFTEYEATEGQEDESTTHAFKVTDKIEPFTEGKLLTETIGTVTESPNKITQKMEVTTTSGEKMTEEIEVTTQKSKITEQIDLDHHTAIFSKTTNTLEGTMDDVKTSRVVEESEGTTQSLVQTTFSPEIIASMSPTEKINLTIKLGETLFPHTDIPEIVPFEPTTNLFSAEENTMTSTPIVETTQSQIIKSSLPHLITIDFEGPVKKSTTIVPDISTFNGEIETTFKSHTPTFDGEIETTALPHSTTFKPYISTTNNQFELTSETPNKSTAFPEQITTFQTESTLLQDKSTTLLTEKSTTLSTEKPTTSSPESASTTFAVETESPLVTKIIFPESETEEPQKATTKKVTPSNVSDSAEDDFFVTVDSNLFTLHTISSLPSTGNEFAATTKSSQTALTNELPTKSVTTQPSPTTDNKQTTNTIDIQTSTQSQTTSKNEETTKLFTPNLEEMTTNFEIIQEQQTTNTKFVTEETTTTPTTNVESITKQTTEPFATNTDVLTEETTNLPITTPEHITEETTQIQGETSLKSIILKFKNKNFTQKVETLFEPTIHSTTPTSFLAKGTSLSHLVLTTPPPSQQVETMFGATESDEVTSSPPTPPPSITSTLIGKVANVTISGPSPFTPKLIKQLTLISGNRSISVFKSTSTTQHQMLITKIFNKKKEAFVGNDPGSKDFKEGKNEMVAVQVITDIDKSLEMSDKRFEEELEGELSKSIPSILDAIEKAQFEKALEKGVGGSLEKGLKTNKEDDLFESELEGALQTDLTSSVSQSKANEKIINNINLRKAFSSNDKEIDYPDYHSPQQTFQDEPVDNNHPPLPADLKCKQEPFDSNERSSDVMFLIEGSSSLTHNAFTQSLHHIMNIVTTFKNVGSDGTHFSLVQFTNQPFFQFSFNKHGCRQQIIADILDTQHITGSSDLEGALTKVEQFGFTKANGDRPHFPNYLVLFVKNGDVQSLKEPFHLLKQNNIEVVVVVQDRDAKPIFDKLSEHVFVGSDVDVSKISNFIKREREGEAIDLFKIDCNYNQLSVVFEAPLDFQGILSVKNFGNDSRCVKKVPMEMGSGRKQIGLSYKVGECGLKVANSGQGKNFSIVLNVLKSEHVVRGVDKSYLVECRLPEGNQTVLASHDRRLPQVDKNIGPPTCNYSLHRDSLDGPEVNLAVLGQTIFHKWECSGENVDKYGMVVHDCFLGTAQHKKVISIVDEDGCSQDNKTIGGIAYTKDQLVAFAKSTVSSLIDVQHIKFSCKIGLCLKEEGGCQDVTPPDCTTKLQFPLTRHLRRTTKADIINKEVETSIHLLESFRIGPLSLQSDQNQYNYHQLKNHFLPTAIILLTVSILVVAIIVRRKQSKMQKDTFSLSTPSNYSSKRSFEDKPNNVWRCSQDSRYGSFMSLRSENLDSTIV